jgi:addiction module HigA family antidote
MQSKSKRHPSHPVPHPAASIREISLPSLRMSKTDLAKALGISRQTLYDLLAERQSVTAEMAMRLEVVIGGSAEFWLRLQAEYDLWKARKEVDVSKLKRLRQPKRIREVAE